jgi:hypothetical protein
MTISTNPLSLNTLASFSDTVDFDSQLTHEINLEARKHSVSKDATNARAFGSGNPVQSNAPIPNTLGSDSYVTQKSKCAFNKTLFLEKSI